jgi:PIN domain nuclease of toxin-antitoxin system
MGELKFLLDTHALLWWLFDDPRLPAPPRQLIGDPGNAVFVSSASAWEICTKHRLGKLPAAAQLVRDVAGWTERAGFAELPVTLRHAQKAASWPQPHRDPFDRMLAAQSVMEDLPLISRDTALESFGVRRIW